MFWFRERERERQANYLNKLYIFSAEFKLSKIVIIVLLVIVK